MPISFSVRLVSAAVALCSVSTLGVLSFAAALAMEALMERGVEALGYLPLGWGLRHMGVLEAVAALIVVPLAAWAGFKLYRHAVDVERQLQQQAADSGVGGPEGAGAAH